MFFTFWKRLFTQYTLGFGASGGAQSSKQQSTQSSFSGIKDPFVVDAIRALIGLQGVTPELQAQKTERKTVADKAGADADSFNVENILSLSKGAVDNIVRQNREKFLPIISKAVEGGGTSSNAIAALLANDAQARTAEAGATVALKAVTDGKAIAAENRKTQAGLSTIDSTGISALIEAIKSAAVSEGEGQSTGKSSGFNAGFTVLGG